MITFKQFCEKKSFNQAIRFVIEKLLKKLLSIISGRLQRSPYWSGEVKALKLTISTLEILLFPFTSYGLVSLPHRYGT